MLIVACLLFVAAHLAAAFVPFTENTLRLDPQPACGDIVANFSECVSANLASGACEMNWVDDGELALCLPCLQYYAPWMACLVRLVCEGECVWCVCSVCGCVWARLCE